MTQYRYGFISDEGEITRTRWLNSKEMAYLRLEARIGKFLEPGFLVVDGKPNPDGSHFGCERNGGVVFIEARHLIP